MTARWRLQFVLTIGAAIPARIAAQAPPRPLVGPPRGTVIVVGGGQMGEDIYRAFIDAAGGPGALIVVVPTAGGDSSYAPDYPGARAWRDRGANVFVLHTYSRKVADSQLFASFVRQARGVWFEGGRQYRLVDAYAGTKTEAAFHDVLARGGVVGGSSAGATILGDFLVRGAPSNNNLIMDDPSHEKGFAFLRGVGIDQHVVARERLADLADSIVPKYPALLPISEDEGTAWVVRGDTARIIGAGQAFAYHVPAPDPGKPFITLHPGDEFNLATRTVLHRASESVPRIGALADSLLGVYGDSARGGATVLVAVDGHVLVDKAYGIAPQPKFMPTTTLPLFDIGDIKGVFEALCRQLSDSTPFQTCLTRTVSGRMGIHRTTASAGGTVSSDVDELYRVTRGLLPGGVFRPGAPKVDPTLGWNADSVSGEARYTVCAAAECRRGVVTRVPSRRAAVVILTNDPAADAGRMADRLLGAVLSSPAAGSETPPSRPRP